jgi:hypothetical protein
VRVHDIGDLVQTEAEGRQLAEFVGRNVLRPPASAAPGRSERAIRYSNGQLVLEDADADEEVLAVLGNLRRNLGQKVTINTRDVGLDPDAAATLGVDWKSMAKGQWAIVDEGQLGALLALEQRRAPHEWVPSRGQREIVAGTGTVLSNYVRLDLETAAAATNFIQLPEQLVQLPHEQVLLVSSNNRTIAVRASATQFWTEPPEAPEIREVPVEIELPAVGAAVRFERTLLKPEDELVIECDYTYKEAEDG